MELDNPRDIRKKIMDFLSRREHSKKEIYKKMLDKVNSLEILEEEIKKLEKDGILDDERFAEQYLYSLVKRGLGPLRINKYLQEKGVDSHLINTLLKDLDWQDLAKEVLLKKSKYQIPPKEEDVIKLKRFLNYRGFEYYDIERAFNNLKIDENL
tara:strand:- start:933 stop:1394 length:462 start_codon:yes stop_codon:yes gene_type:complete